MNIENKAKRSPIRTLPFAPSAFMSGNERELLLDCLESNNWSSFKGATEGWDIREVGIMSSAKAAEYEPLNMRFLGGKYVRQLEALFAQQTSSTFCVSSNSATSCLVMALGALNLGPGDEVIVPSMSFNATATAILFFNSIPVFCEVKEDTFCMDPTDVEAKITPRTRALMVVHLGGNATDMDAITAIAQKHNLKVIEDCAQAPGVTYRGQPVGTFGDAGVFSLTETKNITCGEGGLLITNNPNVAMKSRLIRNHGEGIVGTDWTEEELINVIGMNFRLTEFQAAVAIPQVESLVDRNRGRRELTNYLLQRLSKYNQVLIPPVVEDHTDYYCFMMKWKWAPKQGMPSRDELATALVAEGIPVGKGYGRMMHENPLFSQKIAYKRGCPYTCNLNESSQVRYGAGSLPRSEALNQQFLWFKFINPPNTKADMDDVVAAFEKIL
jgi:perosamine synthetase